MKNSTVKLRKSQGKANYTLQNENSLHSLASNLSHNEYLSIRVIRVHAFLKLCHKYCYYYNKSVS